MSVSSEADNVVKSFRFQNFWCTHQGFEEVVMENLKADFVGEPFLVLYAKLKRVKKALMAWNKERVDNIFIHKATLEDIILVKEA